MFFNLILVFISDLYIRFFLIIEVDSCCFKWSITKFDIYRCMYSKERERKKILELKILFYSNFYSTELRIYLFIYIKWQHEFTNLSV